MNTNAFSGKNCLITGGLGFIGSKLAAHLVSVGAYLTLVDSLIPEYGGNFANVEAIKNEVNINISDVRDPFAMEHLVKGKDFLFNLAGQTSHLDSMTNPKVDLEINSLSQLSILEACRKVNRDIKVVFASTRQLYGKPQYLPVDEKHPTVPVDVNGINKLAGESYHLLYHKVYGIRACALRLTNTYGPGMRIKDARQTFLGIWVKNLLKGDPILLYGDGNQLRDFNYVDDVVEAFLLSADSEKADGKIFNLGSQKYYSLLDVAKCMVNLRKGAVYKAIPFPPERKAIDIGDYYSDFSLIENELGWRPVTDIKDGLTKTVDYYSERLTEYE